MRTLSIFLALGVLAGLTGCGYSAGGPYRKGIQTVYVDMFGSKEFRRDLEFQLTEALKKRIAMDTPYRLAPKDHADTILSGEVLEERQAAWAPDPESRQPREKQLTLAVHVQWKDLRNGRLLINKPVELQAVDYLPAAGESEKYAQQRAIEKLSERIIAEMYDEW
ncbi:MAG: LptE family protein [Phycisphaerae bacterium]|nr:LptE family protein [Phycisphaerae bacterium]